MSGGFDLVTAREVSYSRHVCGQFLEVMTMKVFYMLEVLEQCCPEGPKGAGGNGCHSCGDGMNLYGIHRRDT